MISAETLIVVCTLTFCLGALLGAFISRRFLPPTQQKELEQQLNSTRDQLSQYQHDVAHHFAETSRLINNLTQSYKDVHSHLSRGAMQLTSAEISQQMIEAGEGKLGDTDAELLEPASFEPPRDWAPKKPGDHGVLSEEFGLKDKREDDDIESLSAGGKMPHNQS